MGEVLGTTADRHPIVMGGWYWNNDLRPCQVQGVAHTEWHEGERRAVTWFKTSKGNFDGSRLAKWFDGKEAREEA